MLRDLEDTYRDLLSGGKWEGAGHTGLARQESAFLTTTNNTEHEEYEAYQASSGRLPFNQWVPTQKCCYCSRTGHIQCHCRKMQNDMRTSTYQGQSTAAPVSNTSSSKTHQAANVLSNSTRPTNQKFKSFRTSAKYQALKAALEDINNTGLDATDDAYNHPVDDITSPDIDELMCNLGLKD